MVFDKSGQIPIVFGDAIEADTAKSKPKRRQRSSKSGPTTKTTKQRRSKRKVLPDDVVFEHRRTWGARLRQELSAMGKKPRWLGEQVYDRWTSIFQVLNGHQGVSREVYEKIILLVPAMRTFWKPPMFVEAQGSGAPGPHKPHEYPSIGSRTVNGFSDQVRDGRRLLATVDADVESIQVAIHSPLQPDEARRLGELLIVAAHYCDVMREDSSHAQFPSEGP